MRRFHAEAPLEPIFRDIFADILFTFHNKYKEESINLDPDDGNSRLCCACNLPLFSTPFKATEPGSGYLHDQCSNLPIDLDGDELHPSSRPLQKRPNNLPESNCSICKAVCGDVVYRCRGVGCDFQLDVTCALPVKILHRSHDHRLTVIRCSKGFYCSACGTEHRPGLLWARPMPFAYVCSPCDFWLHPHCAALPNAIQHERHRHPLLLNYGSIVGWSKCIICEDDVSSWGFYSCTMGSYNVHIMCSVTNDRSFEPVPLREALHRVPELVHLPVPDEYTSIIRHIAKCSSTTSDDAVQHQHPLTLHHDYPVYNDDVEINDDDSHRLPKCNGCTQFISPPFYTCFQCPKLILHDCCARLPRMVTHSMHMGRYRPPPGILIGLKSRDKYSNCVLETTCCNRLTNGFTYSSFWHRRDIICSLMPPSITHTAHAKTHVLRSSYKKSVEYEEAKCRCCMRFLSDVSYKCTTCRNFSLHTWCAQLPATVRHVYDPHPLKLVTSPPPHMQPQICDACEKGLDSTRWYYGCTECEQVFHVDCIPCLDNLSLIKYEAIEVRVPYHKCPLTLVRRHMVRGRRCGRCGEGYREHRDSLALECFKCYFSIHVTCFETLSELFKESKMKTLSIQDL
ncbi:uncharacterized protein LOC125210010 [Salvia hispanica]|uniref:uncharacterized protein LOC125210010 n=1 Tax=Salvia hispanica TaxID=49212 RepID=UPI002008F276|nr:uncharacterized protein LOC125210010 [Salvia hispanica]